MQTGSRVAGGLLLLAGVVLLVLAPFVSEAIFARLWGVEPLAYIGGVLVIAGLAAVSLSYVVPGLARGGTTDGHSGDSADDRWSEVTQQYFEMFHHDLGRPFARILAMERELRATLTGSDRETDPAVGELLDEVERQAPSFRLMLANIQVLVQLEAPSQSLGLQPVEPSEVVRRIVGRYASVAAEAGKEITWWSEPSEFGIMYSDHSAIDHIVTNLIDNAVRFATAHVEVKLTRNPSHFFIRVWEDGPGIAGQYLPHIFDRGWTPEVARRDEKTSSGVGLFIAKTLANRFGGDITVETVAAPDLDHHTAFLASLAIGRQDGNTGVTAPDID